jgi:chromatin remodeling complex protein RSC6
MGREESTDDNNMASAEINNSDQRKDQRWKERSNQLQDKEEKDNKSTEGRKDSKYKTAEAEKEKKQSGEKTTNDGIGENLIERAEAIAREYRTFSHVDEETDRCVVNV